MSSEETKIFQQSFEQEKGTSKRVSKAKRYEQIISTQRKEAISK